MKRKFLVSLCCILLVTVYAFAQDAPTLFAVYQDNVRPSMDASYRAAVKKLKMACEQNKMSTGWRSGAYDDNSYTHLVTIKNFADLDKNMFADLETKMGKESLANLWLEIDKCVETHTSYVITMIPSLSYLSPPADEQFRDILFWYPESGKEAEAEKLIMEWQKLHSSKKAPRGVVTYKVLFGREPGYAFVSWGRNQADHAGKVQKTNELFGEEGAKLWAKTLLITKKYYTKVAFIDPELSYSPGATPN